MNRRFGSVRIAVVGGSLVALVVGVVLILAERVRGNRADGPARSATLNRCSAGWCCRRVRSPQRVSPRGVGFSCRGPLGPAGSPTASTGTAGGSWTRARRRWLPTWRLKRPPDPSGVFGVSRAIAASRPIGPLGIPGPPWKALAAVNSWSRSWRSPTVARGSAQTQMRSGLPRSRPGRWCHLALACSNSPPRHSRGPSRKRPRYRRSRRRSTK